MPTLTPGQRKFFRAQYLIARPHEASIWDWRLFGLAEYWYKEPSWDYQIERACQLYLDDLLAQV